MSRKVCNDKESGFSMFSIHAEILKITLHIHWSLALLCISTGMRYGYMVNFLDILRLLAIALSQVWHGSLAL